MNSATLRKQQQREARRAEVAARIEADKPAPGARILKRATKAAGFSFTAALKAYHARQGAVSPAVASEGYGESVVTSVTKSLEKGS